MRTLLAALLCLSPALHAQSVEIDLTKAPSTAEVALIDATGKETIPPQTDLASASTMMVPFVGLKAKMHFKVPAEVPECAPAHLVLGKVNPSKSAGVRLAKVLLDDKKPGEATVEGRFLVHFSLEDACQPFKGAEDLKAVEGKDGLWRLDLPQLLEPGLYALVSAQGSKGMFGAKVHAQARLFRVSASASHPAPPPAAAPTPAPTAPGAAVATAPQTAPAK